MFLNLVDLKRMNNFRSGKLYSLEDFFRDDDKQKYFIEYEKSDTSGQPQIKRAKCNTFKEVIALVQDLLPNTGDFVSHECDAVDDSFFFIAKMTNDHPNDVHIEIIIKNLKSNDEIVQLQNVCQKWQE